MPATRGCGAVATGERARGLALGQATPRLGYWSGALAASLALHAQGRLGPRSQAIGRDGLTAVLARTVGAALPCSQRVVDLRLFALQQVLSGLLQLALVHEIGGVSGVLRHGAELASDLALIAREGGVVLRLAERLQVLRATRQCVIRCAGLRSHCTALCAA